MRSCRGRRPDVLLRAAARLHPRVKAQAEGTDLRWQCAYDGDLPQSAGTYEKTEEPIGGLSLLAYRRVSTMIALARVQSGVGAGRDYCAARPGRGANSTW